MNALTQITPAAGEVSNRSGFHQTAFSVPQIAAKWHVSSRHIYDLCARGELGHLRIGNLIRIRLEDIESYEAGNWRAPSSTAPTTDSSSEASATMSNGGRTAQGNAFRQGQQSAAKLKFG